MSHIQAMNRKERKAAAQYIAAENAKYPLHLVEVPRAQWPPNVQTIQSILRVFRSRDFLVQEFAAAQLGVVRLSVCRTALGKDGGWRENITWDELQRIKREVGYGSRDAVGVYPMDADIVNVANMRHLFVMPDPLPYAWRQS